MARWIVTKGLAPAAYTIGEQSWPLHTAFWTGLLVALTGTYAAARRAGRVGPLEALREAAVDERAMTAGRWAWGAGLLACAAGLTGWRLGADPGDLLKRKTYTWEPMLLITAVGLLAPVLVRPLLRALAWAPARLTRYAGRLVRENASAAIRRTAAVAGPVVVAVGLTGSLLGAAATLGEARAAEARARTAAVDYVVTGDHLPHRLPVRGATALPLAATRLTVLEEGSVRIRTDAWAADPAALASVARLPLAAGSVADLDDGGIIVTEEWERHAVGDAVPLWLADGTRTSLRVVAVMRTGTGGNDAYVTPRNAPGAAVTRIEVRASSPGAGARLRTAAGPFGGTVRSTAAWLAATQPRINRYTRLGFLLVLGLALLYTALALANTLTMSTSHRSPELALLRLAGATRPQILRLLTAESLLTVTTGALLGSAVALLNLTAMRCALALLGVGSPAVVPWRAMGAVTAVCAAVAVVCTATAGAWALRRGGR
jgi:putative ABC transport system permease protein